METKTPLIPPPREELRQEPVPGTKVCLWHRMPGEPESAYLKFEEFLRAPRPRRLIRPGVGRHQSICDMAAEWQWFARVDAFDKHWQEVRDREIEAFVKQDGREMATEHMAMLRDARELASIHIERQLRTARELEFSDAKLSDLTRLLDVVVKLERLQAGQSTQNHAQVTDLSGMSLEDLRKMEELATKLEAAGSDGEPPVH